MELKYVNVLGILPLLAAEIAEIRHMRNLGASFVGQ